MSFLSIQSATRREVLRLGMGGAIGSLCGLSGTAATIAAESVAKHTPGFGKAKSVLFVFCAGGQSQFETWDPKPDAPAVVRGEYGPIATSTPGTFICEKLPQIAKVVDRLTIVRSMSHDDLDHGTANYLTLTGKRHRLKSSNPKPAPNDEPALSAVLRAAKRFGRFPYEAVNLNAPLLSPREPSVGQNAGFLGSVYEPLLVGDASTATLPLPDLAAHADLPPLRMRERQSLKQSLDGYVADLAGNPTVIDANNRYAQALEMLDRPQTRDAFELHRETDAVRDRYGRNQSGQALLLARRLVEAGVPLITAFYSPSNRGQDAEPDRTDAYGWDTHNDLYESLGKHLLPRFDTAFSALIEDLDARGLLDTTLVICAGEFGRAPLIAYEPTLAGKTPGRKHWANSYSIAVAGAGVSRGAILGGSDRIGAAPIGERYGPWDLAATIFSSLGIDPTGHYIDPLGRPIPLTVGRPMTGLYRS